MDCGTGLMSLYIRVYSSPRRVHRLKVLGAISVAYVVLIFAATCVWAYLERGTLEAVKLAAVSSVSFVLVSLMRLILNYERPYELISFKPFERMRRLRKAGKSFPSRHVFSAFLIGVLILNYCVPVGIVTLAVGSYIALERVLLGIHFPKDVVVGAILGALFGLVGILIL